MTRICVNVALLTVFAAMLAVGVHAHAWPRLFTRSPNPLIPDGPGSTSRVGDVMVHIAGDRSSSFGWPDTKGFPWFDTAQWTWSPPECEMFVVRRGARGMVKRPWVISWPSDRPKSAVVGVAQTGPGAATMIAVHGAWLWTIGLAGIGAVSFAPARRAWRRRARRRRPWACATCGYDLRGVTAGDRCPECGSARVEGAPG